MDLKKLSKEDTQKLVLTAILFLAIVYFYFTSLLGPMGESKEDYIEQEQKAQVKLTEARKKIRDLRGIEQSAKNSTEIFAQIRELTPDGSPIAWVPLRVGDFLQRFNLNAEVAPLGSEKVANPLISEFTDTFWQIDIPKADLISLGNAMAAFENDFPLALFKEIRILASPEEPEFQRVTLVLALRLYEKD